MNIVLNYYSAMPDTYARQFNKTERFPFIKM